MMGVLSSAGIDCGRKSAARGWRADEGVRPTGDLACIR
jgi:hypothetical protein